MMTAPMTGRPGPEAIEQHIHFLAQYEGVLHDLQLHFVPSYLAAVNVEER